MTWDQTSSRLYFLIDRWINLREGCSAFESPFSYFFRSEEPGHPDNCMKKYLLLLIAALGLILSSCTKNNESDEALVEQIIGTWNWTTVKIDGDEIPVSSQGLSVRVIFSSSGTWRGNATGIDADFGSGTYTITNTTLRLVENGTTYKWQIKSLTENKAVFYWDEVGHNMTFEKL